jgi:tRNA-2-methylthio-N6-dimethylallyladenosine synthase
MKLKYFIKTFGCQQNKADSERVEAALKGRGMSNAKNYQEANYVVINTCMVRQSAENRVYGLVRNLSKIKEEKLKRNEIFKIIVTGCMVGLAFRDKTGKFLQKIKQAMPAVDEFMPIEEVGFDFAPVRSTGNEAWVPISNGCNNFCTFCVVPFTRGREVSRSFEEIIKECLDLKEKGYKKITLLGQNVNSYGSDFFTKINQSEKLMYFNKNKNLEIEKVIQNLMGEKIENFKPVYVKHLGRYRIPTLFPYLLEAVAKIGFEQIDFISSNPWDFSDELIDVIARNKNITRTIHLPVQSGDDNVLKRMNRWYTAAEYIELINRIRKKIPQAQFTTDIIVGFCGETDEEFENTVKLCQKVGFTKAYIAMYSPRPFTAAIKVLKDDIPYPVKKKRWQILENLINKKSN